jgi:hypothetical protein
MTVHDLVEAKHAFLIEGYITRNEEAAASG